MAETIQVGDVGNDEVYVVEFYLVSDTATTGSDGSNNYTFMPKKNNATNLAAAATSTNGAEIAADTKKTITVDQNQTCSADDTLQVLITKNGTPTDLSGAQIKIGARWRKTRGG